MPTLATRSDLAPRAHQLLAMQLAECGAALEPLLRETLDDLEQELFRIAEKSSGGQAQHEALEALREVRRTRGGLHAKVLAQLEQRMAAFGLPTAETSADARLRAGDDLSLVDPREFDETISQGDLATRTELHAGNQLFDLCLRYAVLIAAPPLESTELPCAPHAIAGALGEALDGLGLYPSQRLLFYRLCERRLAAAAGALYTRLNDALKAGGVLPDLRSYLPRRSRTQVRQPDVAPPALERDEPLGEMTDFSPPAGELATLTPTMPDLQALLGARRKAATGGGASGSHRTVALPELDAALANMQARPAQPAGAHASERLQRDLLGELRRASPNQAPAQLGGEQRDAMELVTLLYDQMFSETRTDGCAWQLLSALQVPLLRVALADSKFFTVRAHPARRLLNAVLETSNLWLDRSDGPFDTHLHQRLQRSVQRITRDFHGDLGVVEREADELDSHVRMLKRRAEITERRQMEAAQGRDRLREARSAARAAIANRLAHAHPSLLVRALLEHAWVDVLTLTMLRDGDRSDAWRQRLAAADQLLKPAAAKGDPALASELHGGLMQVGLQAGEAEQLVHHALGLEPPQPIQGNAPTQTELLVRLKSRRPTDAQHDTPDATAGGGHNLPLTIAEREALATLQALPFGAWMEFTVNQQGQKVARKLAWHNPVSGNCLLVNARGVPGPERTLEAVARLLARGLAQPLPSPTGGPLDRMWDALVAGLRRFTRNTDSAEKVHA